MKIDKYKLKKISNIYLYNAKSKFSPSWFNEMLKRVDIIPISLVLAQAANESSWGESRFAKKGNNYFGMWCYTPKCGIVPQKKT